MPGAYLCIQSTCTSLHLAVCNVTIYAKAVACTCEHRTKCHTRLYSTSVYASSSSLLANSRPELHRSGAQFLHNLIGIQDYIFAGKNAFKISVLVKNARHALVPRLQLVIQFVCLKGAVGCKNKGGIEHEKKNSDECSYLEEEICIFSFNPAANN